MPNTTRKTARMFAAGLAAGAVGTAAAAAMPRWNFEALPPPCT